MTKARAKSKTEGPDGAPDWADETEQRLLDAALPLVPEYGWTSLLATAAGKAIGLSRAETELLLPHGGRDLAALFSRRHDAAAMATLGAIDPSSLKIRERIRQGVVAWLDAAMADEDATRRWLGFMVLPTSLPLSHDLLWASADRIWRWAGDTATDENHYSKRAILSSMLSTTLAIRLGAGEEAAQAHIDRSIENVMSYERFKAKFRGKDWGADIASALGRMRFGGA